MMVLKRKPNSHVVCIDPKKKLASKKVQTKAELIQELKAVKSLNEVLEKENKDTISKLKEQLQKQKPVDTVHAGSQTDDADLLFCEECEYPAETLYELGEHVGEFHSGHRIPCDFCDNVYLTKKELKDHEVEEHATFISEDTNIEEGKRSRVQRHNEMSQCKFCDKRFQNKKDLMRHNKEKHVETLSSCWNFEAGTCDFKDNCWFKHDEIELNRNHPINCNKCEQEFKTLAELYKHRKLVHVEIVPKCRKFSFGTCAYDDSNCWFIHNIQNNEKNGFEKSEDRSLLEGLVKHVENLTKRIVEIESK